LLELAEVRAEIDEPEQVGGEAGRLVGALGAIAAENQAIGVLVAAHDELTDLINRLINEGGQPSVVSRLNEGLARMHVETQKLERRLAAAPYPFEHARGGLSIGTFVTHGLPDVDGIGPQVIKRTRAVLARLQALHYRALGRLAVLAERIEK